MKPLRMVFQFALGCHHSQMSRVFTIKERTYKVCLECGEEFEYSWALMHLYARASPIIPMRHERH